MSKIDFRSSKCDQPHAELTSERNKTDNEIKLLQAEIKKRRLQKNMLSETLVEVMKNNISNTLKIDDSFIGIKATTNEKIGFIGNGEGIAAESIVQISNENYN